VRVRIA